MVSNETFYTDFRNLVLEIESKEEEDCIVSPRVSFMLHQYNMIPTDLRNLFSNLSRAFPTPPIWVFVGLGSIGTNIARWSVVSRIGAHRAQTERTGSRNNSRNSSNSSNSSNYSSPLQKFDELKIIMESRP